MSTKGIFLGKRMRELREKNGKSSLQAMVDFLIAKGYKIYNKSTLSRAESGNAEDKTIEKWAGIYCDVFGMSERQKEYLLRGMKIAVPDTSALLKNAQLIDELGKEYSIVVIPDIVICELNFKKDHNSGALGKKAWEVLRSISYGESVVKMDYSGNDKLNNDRKIIAVAKDASEKYNCEVQIITDDIDYSVSLKGDSVITALHLREYMSTRQQIVNMVKLVEIDNLYADSYDNITPPDKDDINAYLQDGLTLIISAVRNKQHSSLQRREKIRWLVANGADVNKRDCQRRYFPPLSHSVQMNDFEMFEFLLKECHADPNVGSRNPYDAGKVRQKNEGNMPLMIAAWDGRTEFVKTLCEDERTSINQQDANGFTALIKSCYWGFLKCRDILIRYGADKKIVDLDGKTAEDHYNEFLSTGRQKQRYQKKEVKK